MLKRERGNNNIYLYGGNMNRKGGEGGVCYIQNKNEDFIFGIPTRMDPNVKIFTTLFLR